MPVLAAPTAGIPEVIEDGISGLLIRHDDVAGYADGIMRLLEDRELYRRLAQTAMDSCRGRHSWSVYARKVIELFGRLLRRDPTVPGGHDLPGTIPH